MEFVFTIIMIATFVGAFQLFRTMLMSTTSEGGDDY